MEHFFLSHETHKIGVVYIGPGQASDEAAILLNEFGSLRYMTFLQARKLCPTLLSSKKHPTFSFF